MSELARIDDQPGGNSLAVQMDYARAVASASLLPQAYRGKPADIMLAVGLGQSMGLSPAESLYRIDVIAGKPTASAELIAANVRKAGHVLRLRVDEEAVTATCVIVRADDPDYEHTVTRDRDWAQKMGLLTKDNYKKQPATMLGWRAVTACARMACPEALYGVTYTSDELADIGPVSTGGGLSAALAPQVTAEQVQDAPPAQSDDELLDVRSDLAKAMFASVHDHGIEEVDRIAWLSNVIGREVGSSKEMTAGEARQVLRFIESAEGGAQS
jgi:hypothetical protein